MGDVEVLFVMRVDFQQLLVDLLDCALKFDGWAARGCFDFPGYVDDCVSWDWGGVISDGESLYDNTMLFVNNLCLTV